MCNSSFLFRDLKIWKILPKIFCCFWNHVSEQLYLHPPHVLEKKKHCVNFWGNKTEIRTDDWFANVSQENWSGSSASNTQVQYKNPMAAAPKQAELGWLVTFTMAKAFSGWTIVNNIEQCNSRGLSTHAQKKRKKWGKQNWHRTSLNGNSSKLSAYAAGWASPGTPPTEASCKPLTSTTKFCVCACESILVWKEGFVTAVTSVPNCASHARTSVDNPTK